MIRAVLTILIALLTVAAFGGCAEAPEDYVQLYATAPKAPSLDGQGIEALQHMGATLIDQGANFSVYSENGTRMELLLFDDPEAERPTRRIPMERFGNVWNIYVEGVGLGQHYGYIAWGPNWEYDPEWFPGSILGFKADVDTQGNRFNPNKLLIDPYSIALHRDHDWLRGSLASGPDRQVVTWGAGTKSIIVQSEYQWSEGEQQWLDGRKEGALEGQDWHDAIVYEVHLKGFSASPASGVMHPGTFRGMGEKADYFADLGITAVELMPVAEKPLDGTYWGYNPINYFTPEITFASRTERNEVIDEFKWMVDQLHQRGIAVYVDVVYNHTGEGGFWRSKIAQDDVNFGSTELLNYDAKEVTSIYSFRGLDNAAYYVLSPEDKTYFLDQTGVGNQCRSDHAPFKKLITDSLRYWVEELHVDGFRFDLTPALAVKDEDPEQWDATTTVVQEIIDDPYFQENRIKMIAEPWSLRHFKLGAFPASNNNPEAAWYEWNAHYRDVWRSFVNEDGFPLSGSEGPVDVGNSLTGSSNLVSWNGRKPYHTVNFITAHDGFTLYDLFTYNEKRNLCSPLNPICCSDPTNPFCDPNSGENHNRSRDWGADNEPLKRQMMRNMFAAMLISHGTPMILGGDEWMRTQLGNNNAYSTSSDNPFNWFDWGAWQADLNRVRMHDFVRQMIRIRKENKHAFVPREYGEAVFAWKDANNNDMQNWGTRHVMQHFYDVERGPELLVLINMEPDAEVTFTLPEGGAWLRLMDTQAYFDTDEYIEGMGVDATRTHNIEFDVPEAITGSYGTKPRTIVILKRI